MGNGVGSEDGNILVVFALFLPLFLIVCAVVIDVGYWWANAQKTQIAADACALAAARELPGQVYNDPECVITGGVDDATAGNPDYALTNLPLEGKANEPRWMGTSVKSHNHLPAPYDTGNYVEAKVTIAVRTFFGRLINKDVLTITRRAVAEKQPPTGHLAIHAHDDDCSSDLKFDGHSISVDGGIHSNGFLGVDGLDFATDSATYVACNPGSNPDVEPGSTFGEGPTAVTVKGWPEWFTEADFGCTHPFGSSFTYSTPNSTMPAGIYCGGDFKIDADGVTGNITVVADTITVNGNTSNLTPYATNEVLFFIPPNSTATPADDGPDPPTPYYCDHSKKIELNGNGYDWEGIVFNPCGLVSFNNKDITAGASNLLGQIIGLEVSINSQDFNMIGTGDPAGDFELALFE